MNPFSTQLLNNSNVGYATHKIIYDEDSNAIDYRFLEFNEAYLDMTGFDASILGRTILEVVPNIIQDSTNWIQLYSDVATHMTTLSIELYSETLRQWYMISAHAPAVGYFTVLLSPMPSSKTEIVSDSVSKLNYYRNESLLKLFSLQTDSNKDFLDYALDEAIHLTNSMIGYIYIYDEKTKQFSLNSWSREVMEACSVVEKQTIYMLEKTGFWGEVVRQRKAIINNNFEMIHPHKKGFPEGHAALNRFLSLPIFDGGKIVAVIGLGNKVDEYTEIDIQQTQQFMEDVWNVYKRRQAEISLSKEREQLKTTMESIGDGIITLDLDLNVLNFNTVAQDLLSLDQSEVLNMPFMDLLDSEFYELVDYINNSVDVFKSSILQNKKYKQEGQEPLVMNVNNKSNHILSVRISAIQTDPRRIQGYVLAIRNITKEYIDSQQIQYMSYHDALTGLYNRRFFEEEVKRVDTERQLPLTVIMGDVNGLKLTNDAFGHLVGDQLLIEVSNILMASCRKEDVVARWGGDEFVILLPNTSALRAKEILEVIKENCKQNSNLIVEISISLGCATKVGDETIDKLIQQAENRLYQIKLSEGKSQRSAIIEAIKTSLYERDHETEEHVLRLSKYSILIAEKMNLSEDDKIKLDLLALLHDIGKIGIPDHIFLKASTLTDEEWFDMKKHSVIGYRIAQASTDLQPISQLILHHHERYDGQGYPNNISGENIPLLSRIISIVDAFDAMTSERPYREALTKEAAIKELEENSGTQFDPNITNLFINEILHGESMI